jgi:hypothetical protein
VQTFRDISEEALFFRREQITKYTHVYSITLQMENPTVSGNVTTIEPILQIMEDADFHITHLTGSVVDPVDSLGQSQYSGATSSDLQLLFPMAYVGNRADRGIWFKFLDPKTNRPLQAGIPTNNNVTLASQYLKQYDHTMLEFNSVFGPGYDRKWGKPVPFDYTLMRNERLKILIQNRSYSVGGELGGIYSRISMAFIGHRYEN